MCPRRAPAPCPSLRISAGAALLGAMVFTAALPARAVDPRASYYSLITPHFRVHYAEGMYPEALHVAQSAERAWRILSGRLGFEPSGITELIVVDENDYSQGSAEAYPYRRVTVHPTAPDDTGSLGDFEDWLYLVTAHELAHAIHIDTILGLPAVVNLVFGKILIPNGLQPRWFIEGLAVYLETDLTPVGRAHSPYSDMVVRTAILSDVFFNLGDLSGSPWEWPQGSAWYLYGGAFLQYLSDRFGPEVLQKISLEYGSRLIPYAMNDAVEDVTGLTYPHLYSGFLEEVRDRAQRQRARIERAGRVEGTPISTGGYNKGPPRVGKDGSVYWVEGPVNEHGRLMRWRDGTTAVVTHNVYSDARVALEPNGKYALISQNEVFSYYRTTHDLFRVSLESGGVKRLTEGARAKAPDISPQGDWVVFAQTHGSHSVIRVAPYPELAPVRTLVDLGPRTNVWAPRVSPKGDAVAFVGHRDGQFDLYVANLEPGIPPRLKELRQITHDVAREGGPDFTPDGASIIYHSDRDGVYNLYRVPCDATPETIPTRLTRVVTGAFHPSLTTSGDAIYYRAYQANGYEIARLSLTEPPLNQPQALGPAVPSPADTALAAYRRAARWDRSSNEDALGAQAELYPGETYQPWRSLYPRSWLPVTGLDTRGTTLGVALAGNDALNQHVYALQLTWGVDSEHLAFALTYRNFMFHPGVTLRLSRRLEFSPVGFSFNGRTAAVEEDVWRASAGTSIPLARTRDWGLSLGLGYELTVRRGLHPLRFDIEDFGLRFPDQGRFARLNASLTFANARSWSNSISPEEGGVYSVNFYFEDPYVGSEYSSVWGSLSLTHYLENPWVDRHVLAATVVGAYGQSSYRQRPLFAVGGIPRRDVVLDLINQNLGTNAALRGFPYGSLFSGDVMIRGSVEYRLPLVDIQEGYSTLPIFFRSLHGALFFDGVAIADTFENLDEGQHYSVGGELRLSFVLGYALGATLRFGWGFGLGPDAGVNNWYLGIGPVF